MKPVLDLRTPHTDRISYLEGLIAGMRLYAQCKDGAELSAKLEQYRREIERINQQIERKHE